MWLVASILGRTGKEQITSHETIRQWDILQGNPS